MSDFNRRSPQAGMEKLALCASEYPWFRDLLMRWRPAGAGAEGGAHGHLRLAIRNNSMNFYRLGQSVAQVSFNRQGEPQARIHNKYLPHGPNDQSYVILRGNKLTSKIGLPLGAYEDISQLDAWIAAAGDVKYSQAEKRFVDKLVTRNPNIIDLEIAIPMGSAAFRMDVAALEQSSNGWCVVFWEAKLMQNKELRAKGADTAPPVVRQLGRYTSWLDSSEKCLSVGNAYKETCRILVELHGALNDRATTSGAFGEGILEIARSGVAPLVDNHPRLIIEDRDHNASWEPNGHFAKLDGRIPMHIVRDDAGLVFPVAV